MRIRPVRPEEFDAAGELVVTAYRALGDDAVAEPAYETELRDVAGRAGAAVVLVAVEGDEVLGCVTYVPDRHSPLAEHDLDGVASMRMLAVSPTAQGRGIGQALARACVERARAEGCTQVVLHSASTMATAHRLYSRLGFERVPDLDWTPVPAVSLFGFRLSL
ncbi:MAG: GNAT family N-acetyltransferase [Acidimicrobiales bacterium]